jgi:hypothetical protein
LHTASLSFPIDAAQPLVPGHSTRQFVSQLRSHRAFPSHVSVMSLAPATAQSLPPAQVQVRVSASQEHVPMHSSTSAPASSSPHALKNASKPAQIVALVVAILTSAGMVSSGCFE